MTGEARAEPAPRRAADVELLWDLVFAFALTNVTARFGQGTSWPAAGRALLVLALVWWAWSAFAWVANVHDQKSLTFRLTMLAATGLIFLVALAIPEAFGSDAALFVAAYCGVRVLHLLLYAHVSRRGHANWRAISGFAVTVAAGIALLIAGARLGGPARAGVWTAAAVIDYAGPALLNRRRLRDLQQVAVDHFVERYGTFVIICLGESIVIIGTAVGTHPVSSRLAAVSVALAITAGLWWTYFDTSPSIMQSLRTDRDPVLTAADGYSYLHLPLIAGILLFAAGARSVVTNPTQPLHDTARLCLCGGIALYLGAHAAFRARVSRRIPTAQLTAAVAAFAVFPATSALNGWNIAALLLAILAAFLTLGAWVGRHAKQAPAPAPAPAGQNGPPRPHHDETQAETANEPSASQTSFRSSLTQTQAPLCRQNQGNLDLGR